MRIRGMAFMIIGTCRLLGGHHRAGRVKHAVGEAPFVVVPGSDLHKTIAGDLRQRGVEDRAVVIAVEVGGDEKLVVVAEDAGEVFGLGGGLHEGVDFLDARVALGDEGEVDEADVDRRDADGEAVEQAVELRKHEAHGLGCAGLRRDHGKRGSASAAHVLVIDVGEDLVVRVGVDRGHQATFDTYRAVQGLGERSEAVRRAGGVGDDEVGGLEDLLIDAVDNRSVSRLARSGEQDLLGALLDVHHALFLRIEGARALHHDVDVEFSPGDLLRVARGEDADAVAVDDQRVRAFDLHVSVEAAVAGVVLEKMGVDGEVAGGIDRDDFDVMLLAALVVSAENVAADAAETGDGNTNGHV